MPRLLVLCGIPGSGKSTLRNKIIKDNPSIKYVSRDEIRFSLVKENEEYFSKEKEVIKIFYETISKLLKDGYDVIADATHGSVSERKDLLTHVFGYDKVYAFILDTPSSICLKHNELRKGTRAYVPREVIRRMSNQFIYPDFSEGFDGISFIKYRKEEV